MAAAAKMPATEIEAYGDDTRLHFDVGIRSKHTAPFDRQRQYAAGKSSQLFEEPSQETLESQTPHGSGALCHLHKLLFL